MNLQGKKVLVFGSGKSGIGAAELLGQVGAEPVIYDGNADLDKEAVVHKVKHCKDIRVYAGELPQEVRKALDLVVLSPGVPTDIPIVKSFYEQGLPVWGEVELAYRTGKGRVLAITGTNGKTTTTALLGKIMGDAEESVFVVGNIGTPYTSKALEMQDNTTTVAEISSFQLETTRYFKPVVSAILNITPDHMNRHHTMDNYSMAKAKIFANQDESGYCIINGDDEICCRLAENCRAKVRMFSLEKELQDGAFLKDGTLVIADGGQVTELCRRDELKIIGRHNIQNALAAAAISFYAGIPAPVIREGLINFGGVEHRIEYCGSVDGVKYYNDSKATNVDAAVTAIEAIGKDIILIAGGDGKGQDFTDLIKNFRGRVKHLILLGRDGPLIGAAADKEGYGDHESCPNMEECVKRAAQMADSGDTVLLSPACASWDMYDNFEQRGRHFKEIVARLSK